LKLRENLDHSNFKNNSLHYDPSTNHTPAVVNEAHAGAVTVTEDRMSSPPTQSVLDEARKDAWLHARGAILPSLTDFLRQDLPCTWIKATDLFDESTLPDGVSKS
jgi:hypothetical protein